MRFRQIFTDSVLLEVGASGGSPGVGPGDGPGDDPGSEPPTSSTSDGVSRPAGGAGLSGQGSFNPAGGIFIGKSPAEEKHDYTAKSVIGKGIEWPKPTGTAQSSPVHKDDELEMHDTHTVGDSHAAVSEDADASSTSAADIATVSYPLLVKGATRRSRRRNARRAVGQKADSAPSYIGRGVFESDPSGIMHAAKNYNKSFLITAELAEGGKKTFRVRAQSERMAREKFGQHYNQATILKVKEEGVAEGSLNERASQLLSAQDRNGVITVVVQAPDGTKRSLADENPRYINQWLMKYDLSLPKSITSKFVGVEEAHTLNSDNVIYRLDRENPMSDTEVLVIGGAGRYTLQGLRDKARKEAEELAQDLKIEHGGAFRRSADNIKQLTNTLNTIVAAYNELRRIRTKGGRGSRGITDEDTNFIRECMTVVEQWHTIQGKK
jgi:hypothetical protein